MVLFVCSRSQARYDNMLESDSGLGHRLFSLIIQKSRRISVVRESYLSSGGDLELCVPCYESRKWLAYSFRVII
jgi:hypothetical protein